MKLTGKAKEDFINYINSNKTIYELERSRILNYLELGKITPVWGYLLEWADSVCCVIEITTDNKKIPTFWVDINNNQVDDIELNTRKEAMLMAVKKLNLIYNE